MNFLVYVIFSLLAHGLLFLILTFFCEVPLPRAQKTKVTFTIREVTLPSAPIHFHQHKPPALANRNSKKPRAVPSPVPTAIQHPESGDDLPIRGAGSNEARGERAAGSDRSAEAQLITSSFSKPAYTEAALAANLTGEFVVRVLVDAQGQAQQIEIDRTIGYGMDERLKAALAAARFRPRYDMHGAPQADWLELPLVLEID